MSSAVFAPLTASMSFLYHNGRSPTVIKLRRMMKAGSVLCSGAVEKIGRNDNGIGGNKACVVGQYGSVSQ